MPLIHKIFLGALIFAMLAFCLYMNRPLPPGPAPITQTPTQTPAPIATASPTPQPTSTYTGIYIKTYPNPNSPSNDSTWKINESNKILLKSPNLPPDKWTMLEYMVTTFKRLNIQSNNLILLEPLNSKYSTIAANPATLRIYGIAIAIFRSLKEGMLCL